MFDISFKFLSNTELQIVDNTNYEGETIDNIEVIYDFPPIGTQNECSFLFYNPDSELLPLTTELNQTAIFSLVENNDELKCAFPDGIYSFKVIITSGTESVCESYYLFKDLDLQVCRKKQVLEYIKDSNCEKSCDILLFSSILETIHQEVCDKNFTQAEFLFDYLKQICNKCNC